MDYGTPDDTTTTGLFASLKRMVYGTPDDTTTTGNPIETVRDLRSGWFNSVKVLLLGLIPLKVILGVILHLWFFFDQEAALTYYRIFESGFNGNHVRRRVLLSVVFFVIFDLLQAVPIYYEWRHLICLAAIWQVICCIVGMCGIVILTDFVLYLLASLAYLLVVFVLLLLLIFFAGKLHRIHTEERNTRRRRQRRRASRTSRR